MPYIQLELGHVTHDQKEKLIAEVTRVSSEILNIDKNSFYVLIKENDAENWGIGGLPLPQYLASKK